MTELTALEVQKLCDEKMRSTLPYTALVKNSNMLRHHYVAYVETGCPLRDARRMVCNAKPGFLPSNRTVEIELAEYGFLVTVEGDYGL